MKGVKKMSNLTDYAQKELDLAFPDKTDTMQQAINGNILELLEVFSNQGHSGFTGNYVLQYFDRLVRFLPILPLTGEEDEWEAIDDSGLEQNKRCYSVFRKNHDNSTAHDNDGKIFRRKSDGVCYTNIDSTIPITFPYDVPESPEIIDVDE